MTIEERTDKMLEEMLEAHTRDAMAMGALFGVDMANGRDCTGVTVLSFEKQTSATKCPVHIPVVHSHWVIQPKEDSNVVDSTARVIE